MTFSTVSTDSYINYTNIENPIETVVNWNAMTIDKGIINTRIYGVKITKFESED